MAKAKSKTGQRIATAWVLIIFVGSVGWAAGRVYAAVYMAGVDRDAVCANTGVALGDTVLRTVERARSDSTALADRNCLRRYQLARQGREGRVHLPVGIVVALSSLVMGLITMGWGLRRGVGWLSGRGG
ncbi:MAG: hypothetical protein OEO79_16405 [Gemmatimonadota bacterium]|nr:hypothetical protein [Gemmatimonadota bacterium]